MGCIKFNQPVKSLARNRTVHLRLIHSMEYTAHYFLSGLGLSCCAKCILHITLIQNKKMHFLWNLIKLMGSTETNENYK